MDAKGNRLTMQKLAEMAGVSTITVSRALRDSGSVLPATRDRIAALVKATGYRFNHSARNLRLRCSHLVAVMLCDDVIGDHVSDDDCQMQLRGIAHGLSRSGYCAVLSTTSNNRALSTVDGIIVLVDPSSDSLEVLARMPGIPVVAWSSGHGRRKGIVVSEDNFHGGACAGARLLELGRRSLLFLGDVSQPEVLDRRKGFGGTLARAGLRAQTLATRASTFEAGFAAVQAHLASLRKGRRPDGLFAANDALATGAIRAFSEAGLPVPGLVSVIGYEDSPQARSHHPRLTSVRHDRRQGGVLLAEKILDLIAGRSVASEKLTAQLVIRDT
jgi:DNA-binding LacI/PurR family transcriptional regulator